MGNQVIIQNSGWKSSRKETSRRPSIDGKLILKWIFEKYVLSMWTILNWFKIVSN